MKALLALGPIAAALVGSVTTESSASAPNPMYAGLPEVAEDGDDIVVFDRGNFVIGHNEDKHHPSWVCYRIGPAKPPYLSEKRPKMGFKVDKETGSQVTPSDYTDGGYSRGHMAPSFAMASRFGAEGARSTFIMSNVLNQANSDWANVKDTVEPVAGRREGVCGQEEAR